MSSALVIRGCDIQEWVANCTPPTIMNAHGSTPEVSIPARFIRWRSMSASIRAMIRSESAMTLFLLADELAITNR